MKDEEEFGCLITSVALVLLLILAFGFGWFRASQESKTYNRLTGANTTTWDAVWVELRVQDSPKE